MTSIVRLLSLLLVLTFSAPAFAVLPDEVLDDPVLEERAREISKNLRCLVCQNQNIDESNADLARDLRILVRERLVLGDTDEQVLDFIVSRYGDFVLLRPPFKPTTYLLWGSPILLLLAAFLAVWSFYRNRARETDEFLAPAGLSEDERRRLDSLLGKDPS